MLLFICTCHQIIHGICSISIHLMLLFIRMPKGYTSDCIYFNTSHVTVYLYAIFLAVLQILISIHLMLLFIVSDVQSKVEKKAFQYISCYCLSQLMDWKKDAKIHFNTSHVTVYHGASGQQLMENENFNTSHVTVYPARWGVYVGEMIFQYISCYCLSVEVFRIREQNNSFQYISCYCLSRYTMIKLNRRIISIHLMLLFIFTLNHGGSIQILFQYISCYCLSFSEVIPGPSTNDFNTSHVTVYRKINGRKTGG